MTDTLRALLARRPSSSTVRTRAAYGLLVAARALAPVNLHGDGVNPSTGNRAVLVAVAPTAAEAAGMTLEVARRVVGAMAEDDFEIV